MEADLGIDTVKQAEIFGLIRETYGIGQDESFKLADVQTLEAVTDYVLSQAAPAVAQNSVVNDVGPKEARWR